jgi:hypothetical protein
VVRRGLIIRIVVRQSGEQFMPSAGRLRAGESR